MNDPRQQYPWNPAPNGQPGNMYPPPNMQGGFRPPVSQSFGGPPPSSSAGVPNQMYGPPQINVGGPTPRVGGPPPMGGPTGPPSMGGPTGPPPISRPHTSQPPMSTYNSGSNLYNAPPMMDGGGPPRSMARPPSGGNLSASSELLPAPYHGKGIYSHTTHVGPPLSTSITPTNSEPASLNNSRVPSPIPTQQFDALEGQFRTGTPTGTRDTPPSGSPVLSHSPRLGYSGLRPPFPPSGLNGPPSPMSGTPQMAGMPPTSTAGGPSYPPPISTPTSQYQGPPGFQTQAPPRPGFPPQPGPPQPPVSSYQQGPAGQFQYQQPPVGGLQYSQPPPVSQYQQPPVSQYQQPAPGGPAAPGQFQPPGTPMFGMTNQFGGMSLQHQAPMELRTFNLLQERNILPSDTVKPPVANLPEHLKNKNCSPDILRCTLNAIPQSNNLLQKSRLPLGILIHPFKDLSKGVSGDEYSSTDMSSDDDTSTPSSSSTTTSSYYPVHFTYSSNLPVIQSSVIVRCRSCRTYINPFVSFIDQRRWRCNLCYRANELPEEFNFDPVSKSYGSPERRPEIKSATIEFVAPSEYMLRPPQPCVYLFLLDVSFNALQSGYLQTFCEVMTEELDKIPGDARTMIGFITYNSSVHFYNLSEELSTPQMLQVSDIDDIFLPLPDGLLVNKNSSKGLIEQLLEKLPTYHMEEGYRDDSSAMGAALQAALKLISSTGGRITVVQSSLPNCGPGKLQMREDPNQRASNRPANLQPATDFYKLLSLEAAGQQIAIDMFLLNQQYADHATIGGAARHSGGSIYSYPGLHSQVNPAEVERFEGDLKRYLTRKIGLEAVMRVRCTKGLTIHSFHGNFFVRSTDLLSLPNINPDAGFGMQISIEENLTDSPNACLQAALLYTSSKGERRIRVHTLCLPVSTSLPDIINSADQQAIACLLAKMAVDRSINSTVNDAREALVNACTDALTAYGSTLSNQQKMGALPAPYSLRLLPLYILAIMKYPGFRLGVSTRTDERIDAMDECKSLPVFRLMQKLVPDLYPVHALTDEGAILKEDITVPQPPRLPLSSASIDRHGAFLLDVGDYLYMWIGATISAEFCNEVFDRPDFTSLPTGLVDLPELENATSDRLRTFISYLQDYRPNYPPLIIIKETAQNRHLFLQHMVEDKMDTSLSYYEFLQNIQKQCKS